MQLQYILNILIFLVAMNTNAQTLDSHKWNDRLVLVISNTASDDLATQQLNGFAKDTAGVAERKLVVYHILPTRYKTTRAVDWTESAALYDRFNPDKADFRTLLIGLDGGIKAKYKSPVPFQKIFNLIDSMPMRKAEMRRGN